MTAIRERILAEIEARLSNIALPQVLEVERMPSGDPSRFPALFIFDQGDAPAEDEEETDTAAYRLSIGIDGFLTGSAPHTAANALYTAVIRALFTEPVLGGLAQEIRQGRLDFAVAERAREHRVGFALELQILYQTRRGEPDQPA